MVRQLLQEGDHGRAVVLVLHPAAELGNELLLLEEAQRLPVEELTGLGELRPRRLRRVRQRVRQRRRERGFGVVEDGVELAVAAVVGVDEVPDVDALQDLGSVLHPELADLERDDPLAERVGVGELGLAGPRADRARADERQEDRARPDVGQDHLPPVLPGAELVVDEAAVVEVAEPFGDRLGGVDVGAGVADEDRPVLSSIHEPITACPPFVPFPMRTVPRTELSPPRKRRTGDLGSHGGHPERQYPSCEERHPWRSPSRLPNLAPVAHDDKMSRSRASKLHRSTPPTQGTKSLDIDTRLQPSRPPRSARTCLAGRSEMFGALCSDFSIVLRGRVR